MDKKIISTKSAPAAIGPYSQAVKANGFVFTSGQIPLNPKNGKIEHSDIAGQTRAALDNLSAVLKEAGAPLEAVVKTTVFLKDMGDFGAMNIIYNEYFKEQPPARSCVQVSKLPMDVLVEIEAAAVLKG